MANEVQGADASDMAARESTGPTITLGDDRIIGPFLEIANPTHGVQIQVNDKRIWVNVDGVCRMRISGSHETEVDVDGVKVVRRFK